MPLRSRLFLNQPKLEDCLSRDAAHITIGVSGFHVVLIQDALRAIDGLTVDVSEIDTQTYGLSTAAAVLAYKTKRSIINRSYQSKPDNIVGKMTIKSLDDDLQKIENKIRSGVRVGTICRDRTPPAPEFQPKKTVIRKGITL